MNGLNESLVEEFVVRLRENSDDSSEDLVSQVITEKNQFT